MICFLVVVLLSAFGFKVISYQLSVFSCQLAVLKSSFVLYAGLKSHEKMLDSGCLILDP